MLVLCRWWRNRFLHQNVYSRSVFYMQAYASANLFVYYLEQVIPIQDALRNAGTNMDAILSPYSLTAYDLLLVPAIKTLREPSRSSSWWNTKRSGGFDIDEAILCKIYSPWQGPDHQQIECLLLMAWFSGAVSWLK